jgi:hypothetical protein
MIFLIESSSNKLQRFLPHPYNPTRIVNLGLNVSTQLACVADVNRLTEYPRRQKGGYRPSLFGDGEMDRRQRSLLFGGAGSVFPCTVLCSVSDQQSVEW